MLVFLASPIVMVAAISIAAFSGAVLVIVDEVAADRARKERDRQYMLRVLRNK